MHAIKWGLISKQISLGKWHCRPRLERKTPYLHAMGSSATVLISENLSEKKGVKCSEVHSAEVAASAGLREDCVTKETLRDALFLILNL